MQRINIEYFKTKVGELILGTFDNQLCMLDFLHRKNRSLIDNKLKKQLDTGFIERSNSIISETKKQITEYLNASRKNFNLPLLIAGTAFQKQVWLALRQVPYSNTSTYLKIAQEIHNSKAVRAVANANNANAIAIIIPCHRIIGSNGDLVGYAGGIPAKQYLLDLEKNNSV